MVQYWDIVKCEPPAHSFLPPISPSPHASYSLNHTSITLYNSSSPTFFDSCSEDHWQAILWSEYSIIVEHHKTEGNNFLMGHSTVLIVASPSKA